VTSSGRQVSYPTLARLTALFLRVGNLTFGGGDPTMAVLRREMVERLGWITPGQYGVAYVLARITPGTNLLAFAAAAAAYLYGWLGALAAVAAVTIPSAVLVVWITLFYASSSVSHAAAAVMAALSASGIGMMASGAWLLVAPALSRRHWLRALVFAGAAAALLSSGLLSPLLILLAAALAGFFWHEKEPAQ
jgi:chromate transporter